MPDPDVEGRDVTVVEALDRAQEEIETAFADQPEIRGDVHHEMALTFSKLGNAAKAEHHARQALATRTEFLGRTHRNTVESMSALAFILMGQRRRPDAHLEADGLLLRAHEILRTHYADHPEYGLDVLQYRALSAFNGGRRDEAERLTRAALALCREHLGDGDVATIGHQQNLVMLMKGQGRHEEAAAEFERVLELRIRHQGARHSQTFDAKNALAAAYRDMGRLERAETLYREVLAGRRDLLGEDHPRTIIALNELAHCLKRQSRWKESAEVYREAVILARSRPGGSGFRSLALMDNLALVLTSLGELDEAAELHEACLSGLEADFAHEVAAAYRTVFKLVDVLVRDGRPEDALPICRERLEGAEQAFPGGGEVVTNLRSVLARCLLLTGAAAEGEELLDRCAREYESMPERTWMAERAIGGAADLCAASDRADRARTFRALINEE